VINNEKNAESLKNWLDKNVKGYVSAIGLHAAYLNIKDRLDHARPASPPNAPDLVEVLQAGQLSLRASAYELSKGTPDQLKDYLERARHGGHQSYQFGCPLCQKKPG
jgi:hypothetical protein